MHQIQREKSIRLTELSLILVYLYVLYLTLPPVRSVSNGQSFSDCHISAVPACPLLFCMPLAPHSVITTAKSVFSVMIFAKVYTLMLLPHKKLLQEKLVKAYFCTHFQSLYSLTGSSTIHSPDTGRIACHIATEIKIVWIIINVKLHIISISQVQKTSQHLQYFRFLQV